MSGPGAAGASSHPNRICSRLMMAFAIMPLLSMFTTALAPQGSSPPGIYLATSPTLAQLRRRPGTPRTSLGAVSLEHLIVLGVVPAAVLSATLAGYALAQLTALRGKTLTDCSYSASLCHSRHSSPRCTTTSDSIGLLGYTTGDRPATDRPTHAVRRLLDADTLPGRRPALTEAAQVDGANNWQIVPRGSNYPRHARLVSP